MKLSRDIDKFYAEHYEKIMGNGAIGIVWKRIHKQIDKKFSTSRGFDLLEVGSGNGEHLKLCRLNFNSYTQVDIREPKENAQTAKVHFVKDDATLLSKFMNSQFDGLIATCLIVHLTNPELALENWRRVVSNGGKLVIYVPCEPGIFLRFARHFTTKRRFKKFGYDHGYLHWNEHINSFTRIDLLIRKVFEETTINVRFYPFKLHSWNLNLYVLYEITR